MTYDLSQYQRQGNSCLYQHRETGELLIALPSGGAISIKIPDSRYERPNSSILAALEQLKQGCGLELTLQGAN